MAPVSQSDASTLTELLQVNVTTKSTPKRGDANGAAAKAVKDACLASPRTARRVSEGEHVIAAIVRGI
jgi:hypothetical protein